MQLKIAANTIVNKLVQFILFLLFLFTKKVMAQYAVFEYKGGGKIQVSKAYPTWLGCKRERNRIHRDFPFFKHTVETV